MKELFNLRGLCGVCFKENGGYLLCIGKMGTMKNDGRQCVGYVLGDVVYIYRNVQLTKNHILTLKKPQINRDKGKYRYHNNNGSSSCVIKYYWLIRIFIHTSVHRNLTLNILAHCMDNYSLSIVKSK